MLFYANCIKIKNIKFFLQIRLTFTKIWCRIDYSKLCGIKYLRKGFIFKMNMKKLLACVVGSAVLMSNVAFAAVSTTTTYDAESGKVEVSTEVTGLENGSMVTYVLYGEKDKDTTPFNTDDGSVTETEETTPTQDNIIYIDQENNVTGGTKTFVAPGLNVGEAYGAKVIVGTDTASDEIDVAVTEEYTGDMYTLKLDANAVDYTAKVEVNMGTNYIKEYSLDVAAGNTTVKVPVGAQCIVTFVAADGKAVTKAYVDSTEITNASNLNPAVYKKDTEYVLSAEVEAEVQLPVITVSDAVIVDNTVTFLVNVEHCATPTDTGLKVVYDTVNEFDNLSPIQTENGRYAIRIVDEADDFTFENDTNKYVVTAFLKVNGNKVYSDALDNNHFTFDKDENLGNVVEDEVSTPAPASEESISEESTGEEPAAEEPATEEPAAEEPAAEEPAAEESATEEPAESAN